MKKRMSSEPAIPSTLSCRSPRHRPAIPSFSPPRSFSLRPHSPSLFAKYNTFIIQRICQCDASVPPPFLPHAQLRPPKCITAFFSSVPCMDDGSPLPQARCESPFDRMSKVRDLGLGSRNEPLEPWSMSRQSPPLKSEDSGTTQHLIVDDRRPTYCSSYGQAHILERINQHLQMEVLKSHNWGVQKAHVPLNGFADKNTSLPPVPMLTSTISRLVATKYIVKRRI